MIYKLQVPGFICGAVSLSASKSISNRVLILNALSNNSYPIENLSDSDDTTVLFRALQSTGRDFDIGAAGTSMRFLTAYLSQRQGEWTITGSERMKNRPIGLLVDALRHLGGNIEYIEKEGFPPLRIHGKLLKGGAVTLNGSISSQYISALMMIAPCLEQGLVIRLEGDIVSRPYIRMTKGLMEQFGVRVQWEGQIITIVPQSYRSIPFRVESDWSAASYWYEMQALSPERVKVNLQGLETDSLQGDAEICTIMNNLCQHSKDSLFTYEFLDIPDLAQSVVVTCCLLDIPFRFSGLQSLRIKETDRLSALQTELRKLGYLLTIESDSILSWTGKHCEAECDPIIATYDDHRMAMAFTPICLKTGKIRIADPEVVSKSYPGFWKDWMGVGGSIELETVYPFQ